MLEYLEIGKVTNSHGVKGEIKIIPLTDNPERFEDLKWVYVDKGSGMKRFDIDTIKYFKNQVIIKLKGIDDRNASDSLKGAILKVDREHAVKLPENSFFICDLIDCKVYTKDGAVLGTIKDVLKTGSNDVFIVTDADGNEILIPALKSIVKDVFVNECKIIVDLPEGILDID